MSGRMIKTIHGKRYQEKTVNEIVSMLSENTGKSFLDSGGENGRFWQRNKGKTRKDWMDSPEMEIDFNTISEWDEKEKKWKDISPKAWEPRYIISVFHYLASSLELDGICETFNAINKKADNFDSEKAYGLSSEGEEFLESIGAEIGKAWNSYNGDDPFSQVTQGSPIELNGCGYVLLQIHGGADVRGGYTTARLFCVPESIEGYIPFPSTIWAEINGKSYTADDSVLGKMVEDDETQREKGYGGAAAVIVSEEVPIVTACGFDACY